MPAIDEFVGRYRINERSTIEIFDDYTWIYERESYDQPYEMDGDYMLIISVHTDAVIYKVQLDQNGDLYDFLSGETFTRIYD